MPGGNEPWTDDHTAILARGILSLVHENKQALYVLPGILNQVDGHGNNRTRQKIEQLLDKCVPAMGLTVADARAAKAGNKSNNGGGGGGGGRRAGEGKAKGRGNGKGKKRTAPNDEEDEDGKFDLVKFDPEDEDVMPSVTPGNRDSKRRKT